MPPLRLAYATEYLIAVIAVFPLARLQIADLVGKASYRSLGRGAARSQIAPTRRGRGAGLRLVGAGRLEQRRLRTRIVEAEMKHFVGQLAMVGGIKDVARIAHCQLANRDAIPADDLAEIRDDRCAGGSYGSRRRE